MAHGWAPIAALRLLLRVRHLAAAWASAIRTRTCSASCSLIPERAREHIIDIASTQLPDGSAWHQYQPLTKRGNADIGGGFNDDPLWLVASVFAYLSETGDAGILNEPVPFDNEEGSEQPLLEHLRRSVNFTMQHRGPHGLTLIGRADWNDCLNLNCFSSEPGESFQTVENNDTGVAESVFIAGMFVLYGRQYAEILERFGADCGMSADAAAAEAAAVREAVAQVEQATETAGWDGEWFLRAYDAYSRPVGSHTDTEGQIYIEPQGMCVMAGIGLKDGQGAAGTHVGQGPTDLRWGHRHRGQRRAAADRRCHGCERGGHVLILTVPRFGAARPHGALHPPIPPAGRAASPLAAVHWPQRHRSHRGFTPRFTIMQYFEQTIAGIDGTAASLPRLYHRQFRGGAPRPPQARRAGDPRRRV